MILVRVEPNGSHFQSATGAHKRSWNSAAKYLESFLEEAGVEGKFDLRPYGPTRWKGEPEPRIKVSSATPTSVRVFIKPDSNDSAYEYNLVTSGGLTGEELRQTLFDEIGRRRRCKNSSEFAVHEVEKPALNITERVAAIEKRAVHSMQRRHRLKEIEAQLASLSDEKILIQSQQQADSEAEDAASALELI